MNVNDTTAVTERGVDKELKTAKHKAESHTASCGECDTMTGGCSGECDECSCSEPGGAPPTGEEGRASREAMNAGTRSYGRPPKF